MKLQAITQRIEQKAANLAASQDNEAQFVICGVRCRIWYGTDTALHFGYKRPLMNGYEPVSACDLAAYVYRFQF